MTYPDRRTPVISPVVAAWDRPNGTTVIVYADGTMRLIILPHDGDTEVVRLVRQAPTPPTETPA